MRPTPTKAGHASGLDASPMMTTTVGGTIRKPIKTLGGKGSAMTAIMTASATHAGTLRRLTGTSAANTPHPNSQKRPKTR